MAEEGMRTVSWHEVFHFLYGDARTGRGFWYSHPVHEVDGLSEDQLFWVPGPKSLCMLWHVGHIAHRERVHVGKFMQALQGEEIPPEHDVFGTEWCSSEELRKSIGSVEEVFDWVDQVRTESTEYVASLKEEDLLKVLPTTDFGEGLSVAHWLLITVSHGAIHIGRIQMMRAMVEGKYDRTC